MRLVGVSWPGERPIIQAVDFAGPPENGYYDWSCADGSDRYTLHPNGVWAARSHFVLAGPGIRFFGGGFLWPLGATVWLNEPQGPLRDSDALYWTTGVERLISGELFGPAPGAVYLTASATFGAGQSVAQTVISWSDESIAIEVVRGGLPEGVAYLWVETAEGKRGAPYGRELPESQQIYLYETGDDASARRLHVAVNLSHSGTGSELICGGGSFAVMGLSETGVIYETGDDTIRRGILTGVL